MNTRSMRLAALSVLSAGLIASACRAATTHNVSTVSELVDAIASAENNDTIILSAGKTYDLSALSLSKDSTGKLYGTMSAPDSDKNGNSCVWFNKAITIRGENTKHWSEKTPEEETVIDGGSVARIFYSYAGSGRKTTYAHLTFVNGAANGKDGGGVYAANPSSTGQITNCVFRNCTAANGGGAFKYTVRDSLFENCSATGNGGGAYLDGLNTSGINRFERNVVRNCSAASGGGVYMKDLNALTPTGTATGGDFSQGFVEHCVISNCSATADGGGLYSTTDTNLVRSCRFEGNVSSTTSTMVDNGGGAMFNACATNCVFLSNCCTNFGGACAKVIAVDCAFTNNFSSGNRGGAMSNGRAVGCTFHNNFTEYTSARGGACSHTHCVRSRFSGVGDVSGGSFLDCEFDGVKSNKGRQNYVFDSVRNKGIELAATNCLIHGCSVKYLVNSDGRRAEFVNCTFADNTIANAGATVSCNKGTESSVEYPSTDVFINCLFAGNKFASGSDADLFAVNVGKTTASQGSSALYVTNCLYEAGVDGLESATVSNLINGEAKFAGRSRPYAELAPYYTPAPASAARNAGLGMDWMSASTDFAGNGRINDGRVDIGCYESYLVPFGLKIIFR